MKGQKDPQTIINFAADIVNSLQRYDDNEQFHVAVMILSAIFKRVNDDVKQDLKHQLKEAINHL